jgi:hypothetical protein
MSRFGNPSLVIQVWQSRSGNTGALIDFCQARTTGHDWDSVVGGAVDPIPGGRLGAKVNGKTTLDSRFGREL